MAGEMVLEERPPCCHHLEMWKVFFSTTFQLGGFINTSSISRLRLSRIAELSCRKRDPTAHLAQPAAIQPCLSSASSAAAVSCSSISERVSPGLRPKAPPKVAAPATCCHFVCVRARYRMVAAKEATPSGNFTWKESWADVLGDLI